MSSPAVQHDDTKRGAVLTAALAVFGRYGFRKTSMDAVARAARVSRPGLYLLFANKEELYRAAMRGVLEAAQRAAERRLADGTASLEDRLVGALDELIGLYVETQLARDIDELLITSEEQLGPMLDDYQERALASLAAALRASLPPGGVAAGNDPDTAADVLLSAALTWKARGTTREAFRDRVRLMVRVVCGTAG